MLEMVLWSFLGSLLAYGAVLSAASSASSAQTATATNWPPTQAQLTALQTQISQLVVEVTGSKLTSQEQYNLSTLLSNAPAQYQATLPQGTTATYAGFAAWVMAGSAAQVAASTSAHQHGQMAPG